jgi:hypothetical protein
MVALESEEPSRPQVTSLAASGPRRGQLGGRVSLGYSGLGVDSHPVGLSSPGGGTLTCHLFLFSFFVFARALGPNSSIVTCSKLLSS